jgi:membrane protein implicated in regulation of membrane protease activity
MQRAQQRGQDDHVPQRSEPNDEWPRSLSVHTVVTIALSSEYAPAMGRTQSRLSVANAGQSRCDAGECAVGRLLPAKIAAGNRTTAGGAMPWWGWLVVGAVLLAVEMFVLDAQFYLVFLGVAAAVVGLLGLAGLGGPDWVQWLVFAALALVAMVAFRRRVYERVRGRTGTVEERLTLGDRVVIPARLEPGQTCRVNYRGSSWTARNVDQLAIDAGKEAVIAHIDGLTLHVRTAG